MIRAGFTPLAACLVGLLLHQPPAAGEQPLRQVIDAEVRAAWEREKVTPARSADDAAFLRRACLDLVGSVPTCEEVRSFLEDKGADKRAKLIDRLLDDPRFAAHQADVWDLVLFGRNPPNPEATRQRPVFLKWLAEKFAKNEPYDRWARELLLAEGNSQEQGPPLFYVQFRGQPQETAVAVSRLFLGTQLQCAQCHDHPSDKWKQRDFYGLAAFFARLVVVEAPAAGGKRGFVVGEKSTGELLFTGPAAEQKPGQKGEPVAATFLGGPALEEPPLPKDFKEADLKGGKLPPKPAFSRKEKLADWVTAADNPYFARAAVNRVWAQLLGRGLVHPVDSLSAKNPPSHPRLFEKMQEEFVKHQFDLKWLIREVVNSQTYQLESAGENAEPLWFEQARLRPLSAEQMLAAVRTATGFDAAARAAGAKPGEEKLPAGLAEQFQRHFGGATDGRGDFQAGLGERLFMANNAAVRQMIQRRKGNLADVLLGATEPWEERVDRLFLAVLSRPPRPEERRRFVDYLSADPKKPEPLVEEAIWVLLNGAEFRFNH